MASYYGQGNPNSWGVTPPDPLGNWAFLRHPAAQWGVALSGAFAIVLAFWFIIPIADLSQARGRIRKLHIDAGVGIITSLAYDTFLITELTVGFTGKDYASGRFTGLNNGERGYIAGMAFGKIIIALIMAPLFTALAKSALSRNFPPRTQQRPETWHR